jgi:hypothetical protein
LFLKSDLDRVESGLQNLPFGTAGDADGPFAGKTRMKKSLMIGKGWDPEVDPICWILVIEPANIGKLPLIDRLCRGPKIMSAIRPLADYSEATSRQ